MTFDTVYYSNFWYSRFASKTFKTLGGNFDTEINIHRFNFRLLSIFFRHIYIPRTHFITQAFSHQWEVPENVFKSDEFSYLKEAGTLIVSMNPGFDAQQDTERIIARAAHTDEINYASDPGYLRRIPETQNLKIPTTAEQATRNLSSFPKYGQWLEQVSPKVSATFLEIVKRSQIADIPFFHESFLKRLQGEFMGDEFEKYWRDTNSIYLTTGGSSEASLIPYFNYEIESPDFRHAPYMLDRYLISPESLYSFLQLFLTHKEAAAFVFGPIEKACAVLNPQLVPADSLHAFRASYFDIIREVSAYTARPPLSSSFNQTVIQELQRGALNHRLAEYGKTLVGVVDDATGILGAAGEVHSALAFKGLGASLRHGWGIVERIGRRVRFPHLVQVMNTLKRSLK
jgi:hypothetical protein